MVRFPATSLPQMIRVAKEEGEDQIVPTHALKASTAFTFSHLTAGEKEESFIAATIAKQRLGSLRSLWSHKFQSR